MSERGSAGTVGRDSVRTLAFNIGAGVFGVTTGILVAKTLGPAGKGQFSELSLLQGGVASIVGGIGSSITYYLTNARRPLADLLVPLIALLGALSLMVVAALGLWSVRAGYDIVMIVFAATAPAIVVLSWQQGLLVGLNQIKSLNSQVLGLAVAVLAGTGVALALHRGVTPVLWSWSICTYLAAAVVAWRALRAASGPRTTDFRSNLGGLVNFGVRSALNGVMGFLNYRIDSLVLIGYMGAAGFGIYSIAVAAGEALFRISRAVSTATTYHIGTQDLAGSAALTAKSVRASTAAVALAAAVLFALAPWVVQLFYGTRFAAAAPALRILLPGIVVFASGGIFSQFFAFQLGRPMFVVYVNLLMIVVQTGACILLVPVWGLIGAAAASTATYLIAAIGETIYFCRTTGLKPVEVWIPHRDDLKSLRALVQRVAPFGRASSAR